VETSDRNTFPVSWILNLEPKGCGEGIKVKIYSFAFRLMRNGIRILEFHFRQWRLTKKTFLVGNLYSTKFDIADNLLQN